MEIVWRGCKIVGVYNMWELCGEDVTCLACIICGYCVEIL
jgi:hypothetical protein